MKIAVAYDGGEVFRHFGNTGRFKIYEVADGKVSSSKIIPAGDGGHGSLAELLHSEGVTALICGGIDTGARLALSEARIDIYPGASGSADAAVESLLAGKIAFGLEHNRAGQADPRFCGKHGCGAINNTDPTE